MEYNFNGENLRKKRNTSLVKGNNGKLKKMSQSDLIAILKDNGCSIGRNSLSKLENGIVPDNLSLHDILVLCEVLDCDLTYLLDMTDYSTEELKNVCNYTGLSEQAAKTLHKFNKSKEVMNIPEFLSDLLDNYENFHFLLFALEDFLVASYNTKKASEQDRQKSDFRDSLLWKKYYDESSVALLQCQRAIDSLTDEIENDEYIKRIAEIRKAGYAAIIKEKEH